MLNDLTTFKLPPDLLPGTDRLSKTILKSTTALDIITTNLVNTPKGTYTTASSEWDDGTRGDILYVPRLGIHNGLPPILVEIQAVVSEAFMERVVNYSQRAKQVYRVYPLVLVFCINKVSPALITKFTIIPDKPYMLKLNCSDFWAKECLIITKESASHEYPTMTSQLPPLQALAAFFTNQSATIYGSSYPDDMTMQALYTVAKECADKIEQTREDVHRVVDVISYNNEKLLYRLDESLVSVIGTQRARNIVKQAKEFTRSIKRKYLEDASSDSSLEPLPDIKNKSTSRSDSQHDDLQHIRDYRSNKIGRMNWAECLKQAHEKKLCLRYSTGESLRSFYKNSN